MTFDHQLAAAAERRLEERATSTMMPIRTTAPMPTQSQMSAELEPLPGAGELLGWAAGAGAVALWAADGWAVAVGEKVALLLGALMLLLGEKLAAAPRAGQGGRCRRPAARGPGLPPGDLIHSKIRFAHPHAGARIIRGVCPAGIILLE